MSGRVVSAFYVVGCRTVIPDDAKCTAENERNIPRNGYKLGGKYKMLRRAPPTAVVCHRLAGVCPSHPGR